MCHQRDDNLCAGWLACHDPKQLLAMRFAAINKSIDPAVYSYKTDAPVFASGTEARDHGMREIENPGRRASAMAAGLEKLKGGEK